MSFGIPHNTKGTPPVDEPGIFDTRVQNVFKEINEQWLAEMHKHVLRFEERYKKK